MKTFKENEWIDIDTTGKAYGTVTIGIDGKNVELPGLPLIGVHSGQIEKVIEDSCYIIGVPLPLGRDINRNIYCIGSDDIIGKTKDRE